MKTRIKYYILLAFAFSAIGCRVSPTNKSAVNVSDSDVIPVEKSNEDTERVEIHRKNGELVEFDNSIILGEVAYFVQTGFDSLRFPMALDYDHYFYNGYGGNSLGSTLPYYCSGYFTNDSLLDYAVVLIKDSTTQYVIALNQFQSSFDFYILQSSRLVPGDTTIGKFVSLIINTETDREAEHMLGTYYIDNESIGITDMHESMGYWSTWSNKENQYIDLLFD